MVQISYKNGCLEKVVSALKTWENRELVEKALKEILEVHKRYAKFSAKSYNEERTMWNSSLKSSEGAELCGKLRLPRIASPDPLTRDKRKIKDYKNSPSMQLFLSTRGYTKYVYH